MIWLLLYVGSIWAANLMIVAFGFWPVDFGLFGLMAPAGVYAAGLSFTLRDAVQERLGKWWCIGAIVAGAALSAVLSPSLALASGGAFLVSELLDMTAYTWLRRRSRLWAVVASNTVGAVIDSVLFLSLAGIPLEFVWGQVVGKTWVTLVAVALLWAWRNRGALLARNASPRVAHGD